MSVDLETEATIAYSRLRAVHLRVQRETEVSKEYYESTLRDDVDLAHKTKAANDYNQAAIKLALLEEVLFGKVASV